MRLFNAALGALVALFAFLIGRELWPRRPWVGACAGLVVAFQPMFGFMSGAVNNDNGVNAVAAAIVYLLVRGLVRGLSWRLGALLGVLLIVAPLMKGTAYSLYPVAALALLVMLIRGRGLRPAALGALAVGAGGAAAFVAWRVADGLIDRAAGAAAGTTLGSAAGGLGARSDPIGYLEYVAHLFVPDIMGEERVYPQRVPFLSIYVIRGFASFGWYTVQFPKWVYGIIALLLVLGAGLLVVAAVRERAWLKRHWAPVAILVLVPLAVFAAVEAAYMTRGPRLGLAEQGRYLFPAMTALGVGAAAAAFGVGRRWAVPLAAGTVVALAGFAVLSRVLLFAWYYA
jgi:4-amino-4-deoxy-L-arabinose transferase-like glycosyltransferase